MDSAPWPWVDPSGWPCYPLLNVAAAVSGSFHSRAPGFYAFSPAGLVHHRRSHHAHVGQGIKAAAAATATMAWDLPAKPGHPSSVVTVQSHWESSTVHAYHRHRLAIAFTSGSSATGSNGSNNKSASQATPSQGQRSLGRAQMRRY